MNTLAGSNSLPGDLILRAQQRLIRQGDDVPESPGVARGGVHRLCAGAVLVREAVALYLSEDAAARFERRAVVRDSDYIRRIGSQVGLDPATVGGVVIVNDRLLQQARLSGMLAYLDRLRAPETASGPTACAAGAACR